MFKRMGVTKDQLDASKTIFQRFADLIEKLKPSKPEEEETHKSDN